MPVEYTPPGGTAGSLLSANNLSDVADPLAARGNLAVQTGVLTGNVGPIQSQPNLQDLTGLTFTIGASATEVWLVKYWLMVTAANATMDLKIGFNTFPASATMRWNPGSGAAATTPGWSAVAVASTPTALATETGTVSLATVGGTIGVNIVGVVFGGGTGGTIQIQYCQNTSDANNLTVLRGSMFEAIKVLA